MTFHRSVSGWFAAIAMVATLSGCGKSTDATDPGSVIDSTPPPAVSGISMLMNARTGEGSLSWEASAAPDVNAYEVYISDGVNHQLIGSTPGTRYKLPNASASSTWAVRAVDTAGNRSPIALYTVGEESEDL